mmetsp:Transcript_24235/g.71155  ORF Transcript_24235/g.71155 Transcript_24235/m.71155 type:complete len:598 (-) Transcript_24235:115-1908(-)
MGAALPARLLPGSSGEAQEKGGGAKARSPPPPVGSTVVSAEGKARKRRWSETFLPVPAPPAREERPWVWGRCRVCFFQCGEVTEKRIDVWRQQLQKRAGVREFLSCLPPWEDGGHPGRVAVVVDPGVPWTSLEAWIKKAHGWDKERWAGAVEAKRVCVYPPSIITGALAPTSRLCEKTPLPSPLPCPHAPASSAGGGSGPTATASVSPGAASPPQVLPQESWTTTPATEPPVSATNASRPRKRRQPRREAFACQRLPNEAMDSSALNGNLADQLEDLATVKENSKQTNAKFSSAAYKSLAKRVRRHKETLRAPSDLGFPPLGDHLTRTLEGLIRNGYIPLLASPSPQAKAIKELTRVWGVGPETARKLVTANITSVEELRKHAEAQPAEELRLSAPQLAGLRHFEDIEKRIPRAEVEEIGAFVARHVRLLCENAKVQICGSFRRGRLSSGDVDVLIGPPPGVERCSSHLLHELLKKLREVKFIVEDLQLSTSDHTDESQTFMGIAKLPGRALSDPVRRVDIKVYSQKAFPFAELYFTGSAHFNRSMRLWAKKKGWSLSDKGLTRSKNDGVKAPPCTSEKDIFEALGLEYRTPEERDH